MDYRVGRFFERTERRALRLGALLGVGAAVMTGMPVYSVLGVEGLILPATAGGLFVFATWCASTTSAASAFEFIQELNREHEAAGRA